jgi:hypothetical protein
MFKLRIQYPDAASSSGVGQKDYDVNPEETLEKVLTDFQKGNDNWGDYKFYIKVLFGEEYKEKVLIYKEKGFWTMYKQVFSTDTPSSLGMGTDPEKSYIEAKHNDKMYISS